MRPAPRGFALPLTLLFLLALTLLAWAGFGLARSAHDALLWEVPWFATGRMSPEGRGWAEVVRTDLGAGYHVERATATIVPGGVALQRVIWCLKPGLEAERGSFRHPATGGPVLGPLTLDDVASLLRRGHPHEHRALPALRLVSADLGDFLLEVEAGQGVRLALARGTVALDGEGSWRGLLLIEGNVLPPSAARLRGGLWRWEEGSSGLPAGWLEEDMDVRRQAFAALPACPRPLAHLADLGRRS